MLWFYIWARNQQHHHHHPPPPHENWDRSSGNFQWVCCWWTEKESEGRHSIRLYFCTFCSKLVSMFLLERFLIQFPKVFRMYRPNDVLSGEGACWLHCHVHAEIFLVVGIDSSLSVSPSTGHFFSNWKWSTFSWSWDQFWQQTGQVYSSATEVLCSGRFWLESQPGHWQSWLTFSLVFLDHSRVDY
jgi:hypothetical protein